MMDIIPFIQFTLNGQYFSRWIYGGILMYIPGLNFFSLGYLSKASRLLMIGTIGLPTWQERYDIWIEGVKLLFVFILYEAIPFFLFSCGFFLTTLGSITAFFGHLIIKLFYLALLLFSFFLPFAFATFAEQMDFRKALEYEKILKGIKEVFIPYLGGYAATLIALYICLLLIRIPYLVGFIVSSILTYYVLLLATYYFTQLFKRTSLAMEKTGDLTGEQGAE
jgi:hypothetical protein